MDYSPAIIRRAAHYGGKVTGHNQQRVLKNNLAGGPKRLALNAQDKINVVKISDIVRLESNSSYAFTCAAAIRSVTRTLKEFDAMLTSVGFIRVHQSHLVNLDFIEFIKSDGGYLVLNDRKEIPVASRKRSHVKVLNSVSNDAKPDGRRAVFCSFAGRQYGRYSLLTMKPRFRFEIAELIAQRPTDDPADSRMMVINRAEGTIEHTIGHFGLPRRG